MNNQKEEKQNIIQNMKTNFSFCAFNAKVHFLNIEVTTNSNLGNVMIAYKSKFIK